MGYQGELSDGLNNIEDWNAGLGLVVKYHVNRTFAFRFGVNAGTISGNDENSDFVWRQNRNLNFRSRVVELNLLPEIHFFTGSAFNKGVHMYMNAGIGFMYFNPETYYIDQWIQLQPLGTEGQGIDELGYSDPYSLFGAVLPLGIGIEFNLGNSWFASLDFNYRFTLTDYLDDVSGYYADPLSLEAKYGKESLSYILADRRKEIENYPFSPGTHYPLQYRGDPTNKDRYIIFGITVTKKITGVACNAF